MCPLLRNRVNISFPAVGEGDTEMLNPVAASAQIVLELAD